MVAVKRKKTLVVFCSFYYRLSLNGATLLSEDWGVLQFLFYGNYDYKRKIEERPGIVFKISFQIQVKLRYYPMKKKRILAYR